jgi:hypothetical protein
MDPIDYITYSATLISDTGSTTEITGTVFVPFFDFLLIAIVFSFTILFLWFFKKEVFSENFYFKKIIKK